MAATFRFYSIAKRTNSTSEPKEGTGVYPDYGEFVCELTGEFRQPFDFLNPVVVFNELTDATWGATFENDPPNYAIWIPSHLAESVYRGYWVTDIIWIADGLAELHFKEDVLGTFRPSIFNSTQYVVRASADLNGNIADSWYPVETVEYSYVNDISSSIPWYMATPSLSSGYYIVGIINDDDNAYGAVAYYLFPQQAFEALRHELLSDVTWTNMSFTEVSQELYQSLFNPMQYIVSCKWFPFAPDLTGQTGQGYVDIGWWHNISLGLSVCYKLQDFIVTNAASPLALSIDNHPQATARGAYLQSPPFRRRTLFIEPFGSIPIDTALLTNPLQSPSLIYWVDFITGKAKIRVLNYLGAVIGEAEAMLGIDISIAQSTQDIMGVIGSGMGALTGIAGSVVGIAGGNVAGGVVSGISSAANGIMSAIQSAMPSVSAAGTNGSILAFGVPMKDITYYNNAADADNDDFGRPLCKSVKLSTLAPGFVKCMNPHMSGDLMNLTERNEIERLLAEGIYLERWWQR